jgi:hypothetical protein
LKSIYSPFSCRSARATRLEVARSAAEARGGGIPFASSPAGGIAEQGWIHCGKHIMAYDARAHEARMEQLAILREEMAALREAARALRAMWDLDPTLAGVHELQRINAEMRRLLAERRGAPHLRILPPPRD